MARQSQMTQLMVLAIVGVIISAFYLPLASTFSFKLSQLFYTEDADAHLDKDERNLQRPVFPRRDLVQEFGRIKYQCLIDAALNLDGGGCSNDGDLVGFNDKNDADDATKYGVDVSFPIYSANHLGDNQRDFYSDFLDGCKGCYSSAPHTCEQFESDRMDMNRNQPPVMQNYTIVGFQKTRVSASLMNLLVDFFESNDMSQHEEKWNPGDTHTNHWHAKTYLMNVQDPKLYGGGIALSSAIWHEVRDVLMQWMKTNNPDIRYELSPASMYGIRTYTKGAVLAPHVDRLPLVTSAIINVAQDLDEGEAWPLEVYAHDGVAYNVTLEPGDMLLYESHSVIHGRPYPFQGKFYSNVFVHFEPESHCVRHSERMHGHDVQDDVEELFQRAKRVQEVMAAKKHQSKNGEVDGVVSVSASELPFFIQPHGLESRRWKQQVTYDRNINELIRAPPPNTANVLASRGELSKLKELAEQDPEILFKADVNGWQPIHEAARAGNTDVIKYLVEMGVDLNVRTNGGRGASPLWWAEDQHGVDHESANILRKAGAVSLAPKV
mmetsp:Transcript_3734/g.7143  ORF Transcript_3734/g.7143 Transcript_3734/m.7143 type:complete len:550 (+) Transcript_3734:102-1751(+)